MDSGLLQYPWNLSKGYSMFTRIIIALVTIVVGFAILGADTKPVIKNVPPSATSPASGKEMFSAYCVACHGRDAKGNGPAASSLKVPPPDLTQLTAKAAGKFPELQVYGVIHGDANMPAAHGSKDMPVWGSIFQSMARDNGAGTQMRVANLTAYIKSLQTK
jgi:mono/diheme cytochrome c family protein